MLYKIFLDMFSDRSFDALQLWILCRWLFNLVSAKSQNEASLNKTVSSTKDIIFLVGIFLDQAGVILK